MLSHLSPYRDHHINLLRHYRLGVNQKVRPLEFDIFPNKTRWLHDFYEDLSRLRAIYL